MDAPASRRRRATRGRGRWGRCRASTRATRARARAGDIDSAGASTGSRRAELGVAGGVVLKAGGNLVGCRLGVSARVEESARSGRAEL